MTRPSVRLRVLTMRGYLSACVCEASTDVAEILKRSFRPVASSRQPIVVSLGSQSLRQGFGRAEVRQGGWTCGGADDLARQAEIPIRSLHSEPRDQGEFVHCSCAAADQLGRKRHRMPVVARPRWQVVVVSNRGLQAMLVSGQAGPLQEPVAGARQSPPPVVTRPDPGDSPTASPAAAAHRDHHTEDGLDRADPGADEQAAADGRAAAVFARAATIASQADEAVEVVDAALDHSSHRDRAGGRRITVSQKTVDELAGTPGRPSRSSGGQHHAVVTPRVEASPDRYDFASSERPSSSLTTFDPKSLRRVVN